MNPILYDSTETSFSSNGLGRLTDCLECVCHEERNGIFEVDFTYPVDGKNYDLIKIGRSIGVRHDDSEDIQPFFSRCPYLLQDSRACSVRSKHYKFVCRSEHDGRIGTAFVRDALFTLCGL